MKHLALSLAAALAGLSMPSAAVAEDPNPLLAERWKSRPVIVVAPTQDDALIQRVESALPETSTREAFIEREMVLYTVGGGEGRRNGVRLSPSSTQALLSALKLDGRGLPVFVLVGKDGGVKMTEAADVDLGAVFSEIDRMPMRQR